MSERRFWLVPVYGFDHIAAVAESAGKAKSATFRAAQDAGYYHGRDGFRRFLSDVGQPIEVRESEARQRVGHHKMVGEA